MATRKQVQAFQRTVWEYYRRHGRHDLPWRRPAPAGTFDAYGILVSEIMLQQTQVSRVQPKFASFMARFPTLQSLADAPLAAVLTAWSGLGYNRRAKFLWQAAQIVMRQYGGALPATSAELVTLPGIGRNTAGAVLAYAYGQPVVFIETNVRTVFIHHFFADKIQVADRDIADMVAATLPENPREWYWALMDYGTFLKQTAGNFSRKSAHYRRHSPFAGSRRQARGRVLRLLAQKPHTLAELQESTPDDRLADILQDLIAEGLIAQHVNRYTLHGA